MNSGIRPRAWLRAAVLALVSLAAPLIPSGCDGGTSTEAGNPGVTLMLRDESGKPVRFSGIGRVVAAGSNPAFYYDQPDDGTSHGSVVSVVIDHGFGPSDFIVPNTDEIYLSGTDLSDNMYSREQLELAKRSARAGALRDFNVILFNAQDTLAGWLQGVHPVQGGFESATGDSGLSFIVQVTKAHSCAGKVDTTTPAGKPLALFVPGTPYYTQVHGDAFRFEDLPSGHLPLRWVSAGGRVYAVPDSLTIAADGPRNITLPKAIVPGDRVDSIVIPAPYPTADLPAATPPGQYVFTDSVKVILTGPLGASIYYTLDGKDPSLESAKYGDPIVLHSSATLKAVAYLRGYKHSDVAVNNYVLVPATPVIAPGAGIYRDSVRVTLSGPAGATLRYTLDGSAPGDTSSKYTGPIVLRATATVKAISQVPGLGLSQIASQQYVVVPDTVAADSTQ